MSTALRLWAIFRLYRQTKLLEFVWSHHWVCVAERIFPSVQWSGIQHRRRKVFCFYILLVNTLLSFKARYMRTKTYVGAYVILQPNRLLYSIEQSILESELQWIALLCDVWIARNKLFNIAINLKSLCRNTPSSTQVWSAMLYIYNVPSHINLFMIIIASWNIVEPKISKLNAIERKWEAKTARMYD